MFINLSNHPYSFWDNSQKEAAGIYGKCVDLPFPIIPSVYDENQINSLAEKYFEIILNMDADPVVHIMGEQTFCFSLITRLLKAGITCVASCSERVVELLPDGSKRVEFHFERFRKYKLI